MSDDTPGGELSTFVQFQEFQGQGFENLSSADINVPFLTVLQGLSPQVKSVANGGIANAKPGMFHNSITDDIYDGNSGLLACPATTQHIFCEYVPRKKGGGFKGMYLPEDEYVQEARQKSGVTFGKIPVGNVDAAGLGDTELVETFSLFLMLCDSDFNPIMPVVLPFTSTKIKHYKKLMTRLSTFQVQIPSPNGTVKITPPLFSHRVKLTTFEDRNPQGDFFNVAINPAIMDGESPSMLKSLIMPGHPLFAAAQKLKKSVDAGTASANYSESAQDVPREEPVF